MKGTSNLILMLTLVLVVSLAIVLGSILLLLTELYCSPLRRRRRRNNHHQLRAPHATTTGDNNNPSLHSHASLVSFRHPADATGDIEKQLTHSQTQLPENQDSGGTRQDKLEMRNESALVYISNPVYDGESRRGSKVEDDDTPFETPGSSPSRLETEEESSGDDEREEIISSKAVVTPPLTPMNKLPVEAVSVCLKDVRSLGTSGSDTNSNNGASSSSLTPCTSPSL